MCLVAIRDVSKFITHIILYFIANRNIAGVFEDVISCVEIEIT